MYYTLSRAEALQKLESKVELDSEEIEQIRAVLSASTYQDDDNWHTSYSLEKESDGIWYASEKC